MLQVLALCYFLGFLFVGMSIPFRFGVFAVLLFVYWLFIFLVPVYDVGRNSYVLFKNLVYLIDNTLVGSTTRWGYLYPTLTSVAVVVYGSIIGTLLAERDNRRFIRTLAVCGIIGILAGLAFHPFIPIIKRMFTPSYTLLTCGITSLLFLAFYWIDRNQQNQDWNT